MPTPAQDLSFFQAGLESLEAYLLSGELFWPLTLRQAQGSAGDLPPQIGDRSRLTVGGMLLAGKRIEARAAGDWPRLSVRLEAVRTKWRSAWERKAGREVHARLDLWKNYLEDARQNSDPGVYSQQVQWRVMLQLLGGELSAPPRELEAVRSLDAILRTAWLPGAFVWEADLSAVFPEPDYWFLYGRLKSF
ncbi:MAG: hypothetical protein FD146_2703 [Anaerolineaceae bacterium]|nr:MAG: hypothetical protein FD146_2703 [Anaerolineaceae bacterium]